MAKRNKQINLEKALEEASKNQYTEKVTDGRIYYTREFYARMKQLMDGGMSPIKAYKTLGYDVNTLGEDRAYAAAGRAASGQARKPKKVSGMVPRDQVGNLSDQEMVDYLNSRIDYLETVVGVVKKKASKLLVKVSSSKNEK
jgi:hypothetical protein